MKFLFLTLMLLLFCSLSEGANVNAVLVSGECSSCVQLSIQLLECADTNNCDYETCLDTATSLVDIENCCEACSSEFTEAVDCFDECLPSCVSQTIVSYAGCVKLRRCSSDCEAAIETAADDVENTVVTRASDGDINVDYEALEAELSGLSADNLTCSFFETEYGTEVCGLANCCPQCIDKFELVMECLINDVVYGQLLDSNTTCDVDCGTNGRRYLGFGDDRVLQPSPGDGPPGDGPPGGMPGDGGRPEAPGVFEDCQTFMAAYMAVGQAEGSFDAYMSCITESLAQFSDLIDTSPPTASPTEESGSSQFRSLGITLAMFVGPVLWSLAFF